MTGAYLASEANQPPSHRLGHPRIIHYARLIYPETVETDHLWLMLLDLFGPDPPDRDAVCAAPLFQRREAGQFVSPDRHNQLSATASRHALFGTEAVHGFRPGAAQPRFERPRFVVETRVDDAAVMSRLMPSESVFRLEHDRDMPALGEGESSCDPNDSAAHNHTAIGP